MLESANGGKRDLWKIINVLVSILVTINFGLASFTLTKVVELNERVAKIEANRFTAKDGLEIWREIALTREILALKADIKDIPPPEVLRRLKDLENEIRDHKLQEQR